LKQPWQWKVVEIERRNVKSHSRAGSLKIVGNEVARYKFDPVVVQEVRWDEGGSEPARNYIFF
jgi:hypothetical protein